jgi:protein-S-isoprenylcysteine O-methyltransferase Ste14
VLREDGAVSGGGSGSGATRRGPVAGNILFFLAGPGLEAGVGPLVLVLLAGSGAPDGWPVALRVLGGLLMAAGLLVLADVFVRFVREGAGTPSPAAPAARLMSGGAFNHVRHPMYVATATVIVGEALAFGELILLVAAIAYVTAMATLVTALEEPRLARRFGASYDAYRRAVPGWIPRPRRR